LNGVVFGRPLRRRAALGFPSPDELHQPKERHAP